MARVMPGVVGAFSADDLPEIHGVLVDAVLPDTHLIGRPVLARDRVRYVGEPVAIIVANDPYLAADASAAVDIDVDPIDGVGDVLQALQSGSPSLHPPHEGNLAGTLVREFGDIDAAFAQAADVIRHRVRLARVSGGYLEPRACCAVWDEGTDKWGMRSSTQWVHGVRDRVAEMLGVENRQVRVRAEDVGGGFGPKARCNRRRSSSRHSRAAFAIQCSGLPAAAKTPLRRCRPRRCIRHRGSRRQRGSHFKGVGESATIPAPAAIAGAVEDALRKLGCSAVVSELPITPERVFNALHHSKV